MGLLVDPLVMLPTALEAMADLLLQLLSVIQVSRHPHLACLLAHQAALQRTSSLPRPDSMARHRPLAVLRVLEGLLATPRHRGRRKRREGRDRSNVGYRRHTLEQFSRCMNPYLNETGRRAVTMRDLGKNSENRGI
jgi:hypothetical protein